MKFSLGKAKAAAEKLLESEEKEDQWSQGDLGVPVKQVDFSEPEMSLSEERELKRQAGMGEVSDKELSRRFGGEVKSALGPGTFIEGKFTFDSPVRIDGNLTGEVISTSALIVGEQAEVNANIKVGSLVVFGHVIGKVQAQDVVEIGSCGHLEGNVETGGLVIREGGYFKGGCNIDG